MWNPSPAGEHRRCPRGGVGFQSGRTRPPAASPPRPRSPPVLTPAIPRRAAVTRAARSGGAGAAPGPIAPPPAGRGNDPACRRLGPSVRMTGTAAPGWLPAGGRPAPRGMAVATTRRCAGGAAGGSSRVGFYSRHIGNGSWEGAVSTVVWPVRCYSQCWIYFRGLQMFLPSHRFWFTPPNITR